MRNEVVLKRLEIASKEGNLAHACLFCGPRGSGKNDTAFALAAALLQTDENKLGIHPDFFILERSVDSGDREITIDEIRAFRQRMSLTCAMGGWKVAIIERVELLSKEAASAMLKTLEEPEGRTLIIMTAERFGAVLPTIRSRAARIIFSPVSETGSEIPGELREEFEAFYSKVQDMPLVVRFKTSEKIASDSQKREMFLRFFAEKYGNDLKKTAAAKITQKLAAAIRSLIRCDAMLVHTNANARLVLDVFVMRL
jgi:DNA polymerase III delta prime subunit